MKQFVPIFFSLVVVLGAHVYADNVDSGRSILAPLPLNETVIKSDAQAIPADRDLPAANARQSVEPTPKPQPAPQMQRASTAINQSPRPSPKRAGFFQRIEAQWRKRSWLRKPQRH